MSVYGRALVTRPLRSRRTTPRGAAGLGTIALCFAVVSTHDLYPFPCVRRTEATLAVVPPRHRVNGGNVLGLPVEGGAAGSARALTPRPTEGTTPGGTWAM